MSTPWFAVRNEAEIPSPALLLFQERIEANIDRMIEIAGGPERLRPHVKTHKLEPLVRAQLARGITKFKCATIAEAEMTAAAGSKDVMLSFPVVGPNVSRLGELQKKFPETKFSAIVDSEESVRDLSTLAQSSGREITVLVDVDCGMHRTGVPPEADAVRLYRLIDASPGLIPGGLHAYDGHLHEPDLAKRTEQCEEAFAPLVVLRNELLGQGFAVPALVAGGSPTFAIHAKHADRELSPGTTVLWDFGYGDKFPDLPFEPAAVLLTRVVSKLAGNRLCLDLGHKAVASENPHPRVRLLEIPDATFVMHSEEHLVLETPRADEFAIGQCLHGIPRHICPTVALHSEAWVIQGGAAVTSWPITARGRRITV